MYVQVGIFKRSFDDEPVVYECSLKVQLWSIVVVPYGSKLYLWVVVWLNYKPIDTSYIKKVDQVWYFESFLARYQVEFIQFIAHQTICLYHNSLNLFFPRNLKEKIEKQKVKFESDEKKYLYNNPFVLSQAQQNVLKKLQTLSARAKLLYGITGSWKTSIYVELIREQLAQWHQSLLLVPEIILTSQTAQSIQKVFWDDVAIINSSVAEAQKTKIWTSIYKWETKIVVGTRSALFYPYKNLSLIIMDEEHDRSYKSDVAPRYDARELVLYLWNKLGIQVVFWSGTPSVSMMYKAIQKEIELVTLLEEYRK